MDGALDSGIWRKRGQVVRGFQATFCSVRTNNNDQVSLRRVMPGVAVRHGVVNMVNYLVTQ